MRCINSIYDHSTPLHVSVNVKYKSINKIIVIKRSPRPQRWCLQQLRSDLHMFFSQFSLPPPTCLISVFAGSKTTSYENEGEELYIVPEKAMEITGSVR